MSKNSNKFIVLMQSRKFWSAVISLCVSIGIFALSDSQQSELVAGIMTVVTTSMYILGTAIEDYGRARNNPYFD